MKTTNPKTLKKAGIWIDSSKALLVTIHDGKHEIEEIAAGIENAVHHEGEGDKGSFGGTRYGDKGSAAGALRLDNNKKFEERRKHQTTRFLDNVLSRIRDAETIAIFGPAQMKQKFHARVLAEQGFTPRIAALQATGKLTKKQLIAKVAEIFEKDAAGLLP